MNKKLSGLLKCLFTLILIAVISVSCSEDTPSDNPQPSAEFNVTLPENLDLVKGTTITLEQQGGGITTAEMIYMENVDDAGKMTPCKITAANESSLTFETPADIKTATYRIHVSKAGKRTLLGSIKINIVTRRIPIPQGSTIYGIIEDEEGNPLPNVVVSDGENCTLTNTEGIYGLSSRKTQGFVFVSVPSGYEPQTNGTLPQMYKRLTLSADVPENVSFVLKNVGSQNNFKVLFMGDMHLANRSQDIVQFKKFTSDVNSYKSGHSSEKIYGVTLGDMTWDQYWKNGYQLNSYAKTINDNIKDLIIYNTIGNHDHDPASIASNIAATNPMLAYIAPAWYSFNIGKIHFVVIDNIDCSGYDGVQDRPYKQNVYDPQIEWLEKDLSYIDKSTPIYLITHGSIYSHNTSNPKAYNLRANTGSDKLLAACVGREVHFVNGHLHQQHTMLPTDSPANTYSNKVYEHNIPAVCGDWWYSGYYTPGCGVCADGTPYGYAIFDFTGTDVKWSYKGTEMPENEMFRSYDLNNVNFSNIDWKHPENTMVQAEFDKTYASHYIAGSRKNQVLINVWNWNNDCKIEVKTVNGDVLQTKQIREYDPLSIAALTVPYWDRQTLNSKPGTYTNLRYHFFQVQCPDADTDIEITVTDKFGNVQKETMERPKAFSTTLYKLVK